MATFKKKNGAVGATTETINVFDAQTLAPISREFQQHVVAPSKDVIYKDTFADRLVTLETSENGKTVVKRVRTNASAFDFYGGVYALLWVALPLRKGFSATFPSYGEDDASKVSWVTYKVTGSDVVRAGGQGNVRAWIVECNSAIGPLRYWISENAPYIIRMNYKDKTSGVTWILTMA